MRKTAPPPKRGLGGGVERLGKYVSAPMTQQGLRVAVIFGGPSVEHDVSIISAQQLMAVMEPRHEPIPVYLARDGRCWTGDALREIGAFGRDEPAGAEPCELRLGRDGAPFAAPGGSRFKGDRELQVDVAVCAIHGTGGEDGSLLGALELSGVPYVGGGVAPAAVAMDKRLAKLVFAEAGIEVAPHTLVRREEFTRDREAAIDRAAGEQGMPCYVKPATLGSSIGVARVTAREELEEALELCFELDRTGLVEPALDDFVEVNVAILGSRSTELRASAIEQPVREAEAALSFEDKYLRGAGKGAEAKSGAEGGKAGGASEGMASADRLIPAPISDAAADALVSAAKTAHHALGFFGVVRYDFFLKDSDGAPRVVLNEPNTVPGSFAFYLFEPAGLPFQELADALLDLAFSEAAERNATTRTFESVLIAEHQRR
jgi:D-alanine-D-alanine ligase